MPPALSVSQLDARRFARRAVGLDVPFSDVASALRHHGYIQIDPINVCGRMHDLILRNRVENYQADGLMRHVHGDGVNLTAGKRTAFEHHLPDSAVLTAFPLDARSHLLAAMHQRTQRTQRTQRDGAWSGRLTPDESDLSKDILSELAIRGPLSSSHIEDKRGSSPGVWGTTTLAKSTYSLLPA